MSDLGFARTVLAHDNRLSDPNMNDCMAHGIMYGCNETCPVLLRGECELMHGENKELYEQAVAADAAGDEHE